MGCACTHSANAYEAMQHLLCGRGTEHSDVGSVELDSSRMVGQKYLALGVSQRLLMRVLLCFESSRISTAGNVDGVPEQYRPAERLAILSRSHGFENYRLLRLKRAQCLAIWGHRHLMSQHRH